MDKTGCGGERPAGCKGACKVSTGEITRIANKAAVIKIVHRKTISVMGTDGLWDDCP